ncbi:MAG: ion transporter [Pseudomonadota bacterium]
MAIDTTERPTGFHDRVVAMVDSNGFSNAIFAVIILNVISLILSGSETLSAEFGEVFRITHKIAIGIFVAEMALKLYAYRDKFFNSAWNVFDLVIVVVALVPEVGNLSMLRAVRLARALRLISAYRAINSQDAEIQELEALDPRSLRARTRAVLETDEARNFILSVIVLNGILLGITTSQKLSDSSLYIIEVIDTIVIVIFVLEMVAKLYAYRMRFFAQAWNIFDLVVVLISLMPQNDTLAVLRGMRVIRALRVMSAFPQMREVVKALVDALPGMGAVVLLLGVIYYIFGIMATLWFGEAFPQWFGSLGASLYSLFQIMTLESWSMGIVRPVMEVFPWAWAFFVPFITATAFAVLNLFIGILVNAMQAAVEEQQEEEIERLRDLVRTENAAVAEQIAVLHEDINRLTAQLQAARDQGGSGLPPRTE